jgi:hypothetical protein
MPPNTSPIFGLTPKTGEAVFVNADGTAAKTLYTAGANGARILSVIAVTNDTAANDVNLLLKTNGGAGTARNIGGKRVPIASGDAVASTIPSVNLLDPAQIPGLMSDNSLQLGAGDVLQVAPVAAVTAAKTLTIVVQAIDY